MINQDQPNQKPKNTLIALSDLKLVPLQQLLKLMGKTLDSQAEANRAFSEFHRRFGEGFWKKCEYICRNQKKSFTHLPCIVMNNTFNLLFENAGKLLKTDSPLSEKDNENKIKAWLSKTAEREMFRLVKEENKYQKSMDLTDDYSAFEHHSDESAENETECETVSLRTEEQKIFMQVFNQLTDREQDIMKTYYLYLQGRKHLPKSESDRLCAEHGIKLSNVHLVKHRIMKKLKAFMGNAVSIT